NGHATTSLAQVIECFDFGLLAIGGWDLRRNTYHDMRSYLFPGITFSDHANATPLPLLPARRADWAAGFISQYQGLREASRYAKYAQYGYDLSAIQPDLVSGYRAAADYLSNRDKPEKQMLGRIYESLATALAQNDIPKLVEY